MDDSQSSDFFSQTGASMYDVSTIDEESYEALFNKIKKSRTANSDDKNGRYEEKCITLLDDCRNCADQSFNIIMSLLEDSSTDMDRVCTYIENVVEILQVLSNFIKNIIETLPLTCCTVKTFPTCTGTIIELIFSHCKDSEFIYENHLNFVEKQLKELFRSCHELQLTYLMTLQKHFLFDLTIQEEQEILLEALDINLKIGEIVQSLDVKTMAEQWKAYIVICDKYSAFLLDTSAYNNCTKLLASTIYKNITTVMEAGEGDKIIIRSLKVASFSLKILLKISVIFKGATNIDYDCIIQLLCSIKLYDSNYHVLMSNKPPELTSLIYGHLSPPSEALINNLIYEEQFIKNILSMNINNYKDSKFLGHILILISIMKAKLPSQKNTTGIKNNIINRVYSILPKCHIWFNIGLKFTSIVHSRSFYSLYEHLLIHTTAFVSTMTCEEYALVEKLFLETVLSSDVYSSMFSSNLWLLLCRMGTNKLQINTLHNLIKIYQLLESHTTLCLSPQKINLEYTIEKLFENLKYNEKISIYETYKIEEDKNINIWCVLKVNNLPENLEIVAERMTVEKLLICFNDVCEKHRRVEELIKYMELASTCRYVEHYPELEDFLTTLWSKFCVSCNKEKLRNRLNLSSIEHSVFLKSLTSLTNQYKNKFNKSNNVLQILNVMFKMLELKNPELTIILFETFCELIFHSEYDNNLEDLLVNTLKNFTNECDIQRQIITTIITNKKLQEFILSILHKKSSLSDFKKQIQIYEQENRNLVKWQEQLEMATDYIFKHKCIENKISNENTKSNFDMDFESLFEDDEPPSKKTKFDTNIENIICALERSTSQLSEMKENVLCNEYKDRLKSVCEKIRNIVS